MNAPVIRQYVVTGIEPGHMGKPHYFSGKDGSGTLVCACDLFPNKVNIGDTITTEHRYDLYGNAWRIELNGRTVFQMTIENMVEEELHMAAFVKRRMAELQRRDQ